MKLTSASDTEVAVVGGRGRPRVAVSLVFLLHGVLFASWTAHIPQVKARLHLSDAGLGLALLGAPVGSIVATLLVGFAIHRWSSRTVVRALIVGYCLSGPLVGIAGSRWALFAALAVWGAFQGSLDVAMNTQAVTVEKGYGSPIMSSLHGFWSIGAFGGAGLGVLGVTIGMSLSLQLALLGLGALALGIWCGFRLVPDPVTESGGRGGLRLTGPLLALGAIAIAGLLSEGAVADWSAVYLHETLATPTSYAGLAYTGFALTMVLTRLSGDRLVARFGARRLLATAAGVAAGGLGLGLALGQPVAAIGGFTVYGFGIATIVPLLFTAAGNTSGVAPGVAIATVSALGWIGFLCGPPLIGVVAEHTSLVFALGLLPVLAALIAVVVGGTSLLERRDA